MPTRPVLPMLTSVVLVSVVACSALQSRALVSPVDQHFLLNAAAVGTAEVKMGELAAQRGGDPAVRAYGEHMIKDHERVNTELKELAQVNKVVLPMAMDPANRTLYEELSSLNGPEFDRQYVLAQINIHSMGNALYSSEAQFGQAPGVKKFAAENAPVGIEHLKMARALLR